MIQKINEKNLPPLSKNKYILKIFTKKLFFIRNFVFASTGVFFGTVILNTIISLNLIKTLKNTKETLDFSPPKDSGQSYSQLRKSIMARNIFNKSGAIPFEDLDDNPQGLIKNFDEVACSNQDEKIPVELIGILYTGNPKTNLVTFKDSRVETADVYREGQHIIEYDAYEIYKITSPSSIQLRNQNKKICLFTESKDRTAAKKLDDDLRNEDQPVELDSEYVSDQIGPGFSRVLNSARLIPESLNGKTIGFKIYGITPGSLFEKIKLENGDIITSVNGINLEDPSQGFKIYEVLQDETNITLQIKRANGQMTKKVTVR